MTIFINLPCSAAHPVLTPLHKPVTVAEYYVRRKVNKKVAKTSGKVMKRLVCIMCVCTCMSGMYFVPSSIKLIFVFRELFQAMNWIMIAVLNKITDSVVVYTVEIEVSSKFTPV